MARSVLWVSRFNFTTEFLHSLTSHLALLLVQPLCTTLKVFPPPSLLLSHFVVGNFVELFFVCFHKVVIYRSMNTMKLIVLINMYETLRASGSYVKSEEWWMSGGSMRNYQNKSDGDLHKDDEGRPNGTLWSCTQFYGITFTYCSSCNTFRCHLMASWNILVGNYLNYVIYWGDLAKFLPLLTWHFKQNCKILPSWLTHFWKRPIYDATCCSCQFIHPSAKPAQRDSIHCPLTAQLIYSCALCDV